MKMISIVLVFLLSITLFSCVEAEPTPINTVMAAINLIIALSTFGYLMFIWERSKSHTHSHYCDEEIV
jgi:hypothetical protein